MPKEFNYRGVPQGKLMEMPLEEFLKLLPSRQRRTLSRGMTDAQKKLLKKLKIQRKKPVRTKARDMIIIPEMIGKRLEIYNGLNHVAVEIKPEMIGHYLGEFALTRRRVMHGSPGFGATRGSKAVPLK
ncbi:MAG: 30S ribosomal protein S19 [Candidatus Aenigmarchaeota archaeon]|nr:30S ribosomal protein S19 [Candidatus Aenigmarchaeota archaeon]